MKKTLFIFCLGLTLVNAKATVWTVNNVNYENADFDQIQVAINSVLVSAGDTLYVEGSPDAYDNFTTTKKITIIGPGYFLSQNQISVNVNQAILDDATFELGSEGSVIIGMTFRSSSFPTLYIKANNILIERCFVDNNLYLIDGAQSVIIRNNYIKYIANEPLSGDQSFSNISVYNNIIDDIILESTSTFSFFDNNVLIGDRYKLTAQNFRNNIIIDGSERFEITSANILNNIGTNGLFSDTKNYNVVDISTLFVGGDIPDAQYILSEDSYAKGKGHDGGECGVFGGENPYVLSGLPTIPVITVLDTDGIGTKEDGLRITIGVQSF